MGCIIDELKTKLEGVVTDATNLSNLTFELNKLKDIVEASRKVNIRSYDPNASELEKKYQALSNLNAKVAHYDGKTFKTIEHAFQYAKAQFFGDEDVMKLLQYANRPYLIKGSGAFEFFPAGTRAAGVKAKQQNGDKARYPDFGSYAYDLGQTVKGYDDKKWGKVSDRILEEIMEDHYRTNTYSQKLLLESGNMTFVHEVKDAKYAELFPKLLMGIREKLRKELGGSIKQPQTNINKKDGSRPTFDKLPSYKVLSNNNPSKPNIKQEKDSIIDIFNREGC